MERTRGSQSEIGMMYQYAVTAYLAGQLSANPSVQDYIIYSSEKSALKFDDIVAKIQLKGRDEWFLSLIQVKHKESKNLNVSDILKGQTIEYDLSEYITSFNEIMDDAKLACRQNIPSDNIRFCIFSNKIIETPALLRRECTFELDLRRYSNTDVITSTLLPFGDRCWKFDCRDLGASEYRRFLDGCYLYLEEASYSKINKRIQRSCSIDNANDIVNYVKDYFNNNFLHKQGLHKQVFEVELQKIRLSNFVLPLTHLVDLVEDDRIAIWNEITLAHDITFVSKADDVDIEGCLFACAAQRLNSLLKTNIDWNRIVFERQELDSDIINKFLAHSRTKTLRYWISPPSTLKFLIVELWKFGDLPLILETDINLKNFEKYAHLKRNYVVIGDAQEQLTEASPSKLNIFSHLGNITDLHLRNRILENTIISLQGRKDTSLKDILLDDMDLLATFSSVNIIGLMKKRSVYLKEDSLRDTNFFAFLIEDEKCVANTEFIEPHVTGDNIVIECHPDKAEEWFTTIKENPSCEGYTTFRLRRIDHHIELMEGDKKKLSNYFIDQYGDPVYSHGGNSPINIIGDIIPLNEVNHVHRYLRRVTLSDTYLNSGVKAIFLLSGDIETLNLPIKVTKFKNVHDAERTIMEGKNYYVNASDKEHCWNELSHLKYAILDIIVKDGKMELIRCSNCDNLNPFISYEGRRFSEKEFFTEVGDSAVTVVTGEPGMGKSSLLKFLSSICDTKKYVLFYDLVYFQNFLNRNKNILTKPIECIFGEIRQSKTKRYDNFLQVLREKKIVMLLLDSFDEVISSCEKDVLAFIRAVVNSGIQIIVASRLKDCALLMNEFNAQVIKLDPLSCFDDRGYPAEWKISSDVLTNIPSEFTTNPLYLNFLQMIFEKKQQLTSITKFELYEKVINMKIERRLRRIMISSYEAAIKDLVTLFERLALVVMFGKEKIEGELRWECNTESFDCIKFGIVTHFKQGCPVFDHFTFVEFLIAQWLVKAKRTRIYGKVAQNIYKQLLDEGKMHVLDILCEHIDVHKAILDRNVLKITKICEESPNCLNDVDKLGRTALHTATIVCRGVKMLDAASMALHIMIQSMRSNSLDMTIRDTIMEWDWSYYVDFDMFAVQLCHLCVSTAEIYLDREKSKIVERQEPSAVFPIEDFSKMLEYALGRLAINTIAKLLILQNYKNKMFYDFYQACLQLTTDTQPPPRNLNIKVEGNLTPLHVACIFGSEPMVQHLIQVGAHINATDEFGSTPLHYNIMRYVGECDDTATNQNVAITRLLLKHGADVNTCHVSFFKTPLNIGAYTSNIEMLKLLLEGDIDIDIKCGSDRTALLSAAHQKNVDFVKVLLEKGANPLLEDDNCYALIHVAAYNQDENIIKLALEKGVSVNFPNVYGETALHIAAFEKLLDVVRLLVENGADVNHKNKCGHTPLHYAIYESGVGKLPMKSSGTLSYEKPLYATPTQTPTDQKVNIIALLLENGADANALNEEGHSPFHVAATEFENVDVVKLFLERGANVNHEDTSGKTALHRAAYGTRVDIMKLLSENGGDTNLLNKVGFASLRATAFDSGSDKVEDLLKIRPEVNLHYLNYETFSCRKLFERRTNVIKLFLENQTGASLLQSKCGDIPLHVAAHNANDNIVELLLQQGANVNHQTLDGETALYCAVSGRRLKTIKLLLQNETKLNIPNKYGCTPLHEAVRIASDDIVKLLLEKGAKVNLQSTKGETALHMAVDEEYMDDVRMLLEKGIKANLENEAYASLQDNEGIVRLLLEVCANINTEEGNSKAAVYNALQRKRLNNIQLLLENGADANLQSKDGTTPLHFAVKGREEDIVRLLLEGGINVNIQNMDGETALHKAVEGKGVNIVKLLLENVADVNLRNRSGSTPLHFAAYGGDEQIVQLLLDAGAHVNIQNVNGETALHRAVDGKSIGNIRLLLQNGADANLRDKDGYAPIHSEDDDILRFLSSEM